MNNRPFIMSLCAGLLAVFFVNSYVESQKDLLKKNYGDEQLVVTPKQDIKEMQSITENMLTFKPVPKSFIEPNAILALSKDTTDTKSPIFKSIAGTIAVVPIKKGEQLTYTKITEIGLKTGLAPQVTPGKRAVALPVSEVTGINKLLKPGDRVDIIFTGDLGTGKENKIAKTIFQDVIVLAVGKFVANHPPRVVEVDSITGKEVIRNLAEDTSFSSVTVELEPIQAQMIALLTSSSDVNLTLSLRNNDDTNRSNIPSVGFRETLGGDYVRIGPRR